MNDLIHTTAAVTVMTISTGGKTTPRNENDVDFLVKYPEGYSGPRFMPEGVTVISKESAEDFTKRGIGSVVTTGGDSPEGEQPAPEEPKNYDAMKKEQLVAELTSRNIEFPGNAKKDDLIALLKGNDGSVVTTGGDSPEGEQ